MKPVYHSQFDSPLGTLYLGMTDRGLCSLSWNAGSWERFLDSASKRFSVDVVHGDKRFTGIKRELEEYFNENPAGFRSPVDLFMLTPFQRKVLFATRHVAYGTVRSYREIAGDIDSPSSSRAVGNALGKNPVPVVIPCHRIIKSDGTIGGFSGGLGVKRYLMRLEHMNDRLVNS